METTTFTPEQTEGMFAIYSAGEPGPISRYRSHLIGGGIIALLALFLYGSGLLSGTLRSWTSADSMTAAAIRPGGTNRPPASTTKPNVSKPTVDNQVPDNQVADNQVSDKPVVDKKDRVAQKTKASVSAETGASVPHDSLVKAMIVLPPRSAQVEAMSQSDTADRKRGAEDKVAPAQNDTRPRVVKDPSP